jgi:hypothetical protein
MKAILRLLGAAALALTIVPPCLVFTGHLDGGLLKQLMLAGTILWFAAATALASMSREPQR